MEALRFDPGQPAIGLEPAAATESGDAIEEALT